MSSSRGSAADRASRTQSELFSRYGGAGIAALRPTQAYIRDALQVGQPDYVKDAYTGARTSALEQSAQGTGGLAEKIGLNSASGGSLRALTDVIAGGGKAFATESAGITATQNLAKIEQTNKLYGLLAGQGADATQLSAGFGSLANRGLGLSMQGGNAAYELLMGLGSAGAQGYFNYLQGQQLGQNQRYSLVNSMAGQPQPIYGGTLPTIGRI